MKEYDIAIIGGGPAGMMAAIAANGNVVILEKNPDLGCKLLLTGGGRCNITNNKPIKELLNSFDDKNFLKHAFYTLTNEKLLNLFESKGLNFIEEDNNRIFPETEKASDVLKILKEYLREVDVLLNFNVTSITKKYDKFIINDSIKASKVIIAAGGITYPETGSTGDGFELIKTEISPLRYGLAPLISNSDFRDIAGVNFYNVSLQYKDKTSKGDVLITHKGFSGPAILDISNEISKNPCNNIEIAIDFLPDLNKEDLSTKFNKDFQNKGKTLLKNYLKYYLPNSFISFFLSKIGVDGDVKLANVLKTDKLKIISSLKGLKFEIIGINKDLSKITIGGIKSSVINSKTMESTTCKGVYYAGEILEPAGPSGGYNLKIAFSTGYLAGLSASKWGVFMKKDMFMGASTKQGLDIANKSREIIRNIIGDEIKDLKPAEKDIVERIVHSTADPEYAKLVYMSSDFVDVALKSMKNNETILTDINMVKAGITRYDGDVRCYITNEDVKKIAKENQITRAAAAIRYASLNDFEGIVVSGNAPTAVWEAMDLYEKDEINLKAIVGVPVGFVGAADSKEALKNSNIPNIITEGPKGGTPIAVACVNSLIQSLKEV